MRPEIAVRRWMLAPALLLFAAVALVPIVELIAMSLTRIDWIQGRRTGSSSGLDQYVRVFGDSLFRAGVFKTLLFSLALCSRRWCWASRWR
jgi:ABC-type sugar transport system permease subunit